MSFLYPQFLYALAAVGIPIAIHLFNFQRPKKVAFTNVRFLQSVKSATDSNLRLKHLLVLLARILFIVFLVLAFAQPFLQRNALGIEPGQKPVSIWLDNSYSLQNEEGETSLLNLAVEQADRLVNSYPATTPIHFMTNAFEGQGQYFNTREKVRDRIAETDYANAYREAEAIARRQENAFATSAYSEGGELFWFSDFQKSTLGDLEQISLDSTQQLYLVPLQAPEIANVYVDSVWLENPFFRAGENNQLQVRMANAGKTGAESLTIKLLIDDIQVSTATVSIPSNATQEVTLTFSTSGNEAKRCRLTFEDYPVTFDNQYYFVLRNARQINIIRIGTAPRPYLSKVYQNEQYFNLRDFNAGNVDYDFLGRADLILLDGLASIDAALAEAIQKSVSAGHSLAVFPGTTANVASYNQLMTLVGGPTLQGAQVSLPASDAAHTLAAPEQEAPFFEGVFEPSTDRNPDMPFANNVLTWRGGQVLLRYRSGAPFLSTFNQDKVYLYGTPLADTYTNFPRHSLFVPVMYRMAMLSLRESEPLAFSFQDGLVRVGVGNVNVGNQVFTLRGEEAELIPQQRMSGSDLQMELPRLGFAAGFYDLLWQGKAVKTVALNYGKQESVLDFWTVDELTQLFANNPRVKIFDTSSSNDVVATFQESSVGLPLWKYALLAALFFLMTEILLLRFWKS
ncbi:N-terminal double-transmembrane domain-containing protein [Catalinimonas alkaloidigena]|uniref:N-terminal double-transmembrane domain-containing protein n=1 Tax=Catalinimonas alkaloidigena TaxID=1075417 RepID=A0A1G9USG6_9BACT|nr:BatA domain-containing protein [Catalinimonas alkaloidigena]SDM62861.1 N-terminal double-transmembrane domain-containing protein [Catalinimonas alkaloidigena]